MINTDDHQAYVHGMPPLRIFFEKSFPFIRAAKTHQDAIAWYESMRVHLDETGCAKLDDWLRLMPAEH